MFLHFLESACQKRIRQSKIGRFACHFLLFLCRNCTRLLVHMKTIVQWTDQMSHRDACVSPGDRTPHAQKTNLLHYLQLEHASKGKGIDRFLQSCQQQDNQQGTSTQQTNSLTNKQDKDCLIQGHQQHPRTRMMNLKCTQVANKQNEKL